MNLGTSEWNSYEALLVKLGKRFGSLRQQTVGTVRIKKRQHGESIPALGDDLRQMAYKVDTGLDFNVQEITELNQLYKTITLEIKCSCLNRNFQTVSEAVDVIDI